MTRGNAKAAKESRRAALEQLRDTLAEQLDKDPTAALATEYRRTLNDLAELIDTFIDETVRGVDFEPVGAPTKAPVRRGVALPD